MPAFNNGFPVTYQPAQVMYPQIQPPMPQMPTPPTTSQPQGTSIVWVQGEAGAKAYPVAAGNSVMLLDSENSVFYIKSTDASGMPQPLRTFDFTERTQQVVEQHVASQIDTSQFVSRQEFDELKHSVNSMTYKRKEKNNNGKPVE